MSPRCHALALGALAVAGALALTACGGSGPSAVPEQVIVENIHGTAYLGQQKWEEADAAFARALALRPDDPLLLTNRAIALNQEGEIERSVELLERALALDADHPQAHYNLGLIESRRGNFEPAAEHLLAVARHDPRDLFTQYYLGSALSRTGREDEAIAAYRAALAIDPDHVSSLYGLGRALLQRGEREEGSKLIERSQEVRARSGLDEAVGGQYGEQGPYAMGTDYPADALAAPAPIALSFRPIARAATAGAGSPPPFARFAEGTTGRAGIRVAAGGALQALSPSGWIDALETDALALALGDLGGNGAVDLVVLAIDGGALGVKRFRPDATGGYAAAETLGAVPGASAGPDRPRADLALVDLDHDGDLDVFLCWTAAHAGTASGCTIGTNDGTGRLDLRSTAEHGFTVAAAPGAIAVTFSDLDNDRDVDLIVAEHAGLHVFSNQRDGTFADVSERIGLGAAFASGGVAVADLDKDGRMDLVTSGPRVEILLNRPDGFERSASFEAADGVAPGVVVLDFDDDGFLDLACPGAGGISLVRNEGGGRFTTELPAAIEPAAGRRPATPLAALDYDGDGDPDLATWERAGESAEIVLYSNEGGNANHWIRIESRGVGDNSSGVGSKVEVLAGALRQKFEIHDALPLLVGLGSRDAVQSARFLWPSGVLQDEIDLAAGGSAEITQLDRKGTSCPLLYAWRDGAWRFVTDFLGGSAIGYRHAKGVFGLPDTDEYVRIDGGIEADEEGRLRLRLNNQLEEVLWFDQAELVVVDHPVGTEVYPDERLMPGPPFPEFRLYASADIRPIAAAREVDSGRDVTERLRERDRVYADGFRLLRPKGYAAPHTLEIDLGRLPARARTVLLLDGWIDYADSTSNVAAHQAGLALVAPRLFAADGFGGWREVERRMGFPAGLPKTMTVDVSGVFPSADRRLRIETTMRIYWDRARVMVGGERTDLHVRRMAPAAAELRFGGFPAPVSPDGAKPFEYDPLAVAPDGGFKAHVGAYTGFGDVRALLDRIDDRFVTTRNGDEIELAFPAPAPPEPGYVRTYLLYADGFGKDMDPNSAASDEVGPVPFHGMPGYPYPDDVAPPFAADVHERPARRVLPAPDGLPGAVPQILASAVPDRAR